MSNGSTGDIIGTAGHEDLSRESLSSDLTSAEDKKKLTRMIGGGMGGLRQISFTVCQKVESKGRTTYPEVADEVTTEFFAGQNNPYLNEFVEKNIRRRVYDSINVLMALDVITKHKKEIHWKGLPGTNVMDAAEIKALRVKLETRIGKKEAYLKDLEEQIAALQNLMLRNQKLLESGYVSSQGGFSLPFILVQASPNATVEIEISEDMQLVHFDFNSTPFSLHDDAYILKLLRRQQRAESNCVSQSSVDSSPGSNITSGGTKPFYWNSETDALK